MFSWERRKSCTILLVLERKPWASEMYERNNKLNAVICCRFLKYTINRDESWSVYLRCRMGKGRDALSLSKLGHKLKGVFKSQTGTWILFSVKLTLRANNRSFWIFYKEKVFFSLLITFLLHCLSWRWYDGWRWKCRHCGRIIRSNSISECVYFLSWFCMNEISLPYKKYLKS